MIGRKNPSSTVFWDDIYNDKALKACSFAARGLWLQVMLPLAASCESDPGYVIVEGMPSKIDDLPETLARAAGGGTADEIKDLVAELVAKKVVGIDRGYVFNRRMVEAHGLSGKRSRAGQAGAASTHGKNKINADLPRQNAGKVSGKEPGTKPGSADGNDAGKSPSSSYLHSSVLQESPTSAASSPLPAREAADTEEGRAAPDDSDDGGEENGTAFDVARAGVMACELGGLDRARATTDSIVVEGWLRRGWHLETQIEPAIRGTAARPDYKPPQSLKYFTPIIEEFVAAIGHRPVSPGRSSAPVLKSADGQPWDHRVGGYARDQAAGKQRILWLNDWGPRPDQSGCWAPRKVLIKHGFRSADA